MAAKRYLEESGTPADKDQIAHKRMKTGPSFASVIGKVVMGNFLQDFCSALEPMLRRVVNEEVEDGLRRNPRILTRSPSFRIQAPEPSTLKLIFSKNLSTPIFTGSKILDAEGQRLRIILVDTRFNQIVPTSLPFPIKLEILVVDGDFPRGDTDNWSKEEFNKNIVKERTGKRPLLAGELQVTMREGVAPVGDIEFTDNSSWIRSRMFRVGVRVNVQGNNGGLSIQEGMTEPFVVKDQRGESYKKHHPPMLEDEVWRLEKIGKDGAFHKRLASEGINSVQDFLKLYILNSSRLKTILGDGMSQKMWESMVNHARNCDLGSKLYVCRAQNYTIFMDPICQVVSTQINGDTYATRDLTAVHRAYIESLVKEAYANWTSLEVVDRALNGMGLITQGDMVEEYSGRHQNMVRSFQQHQFLNDGSMEVASLPSNAQEECSDWVQNSAYLH